MLYTIESKVCEYVKILLDGETLYHQAARRSGKTTLAISLAKSLKAWGKNVYYICPNSQFSRFIKNREPSLLCWTVNDIEAINSVLARCFGFNNSVFICDEIYPSLNSVYVQGLPAAYFYS